ncbi:hypothetical protein ACF0H5_013895 [Mactra antiquata]
MRPEKQLQFCKIIKKIHVYDGFYGNTDAKTDEEDIELLNLDANTPETQMQRAERLGLKLDSEKVFDHDKHDKSKSLPKVLVRRSKLNVYIPQAERERESISSARSSRRGTPDSGIEDSLSNQGLVTPRTPKVKITSEGDKDVGTSMEGFTTTDDQYVDDNDKLDGVRRPATSFTGLRRGTLEGEKLNSDRPHTAHVRFKAELEFIVELPDQLDDLQSAFEEALKKYQNLPGTPSVVTADTLYKNDGLNFEDNWQERVIERHILLRMQKEIRAQSAAQRRQAFEMIQKDRHSSKLFPSRCDSAIGGLTDRESSINTTQRATTSMSLPISIGYGTAPPPTPGERPKTANPVLEKQKSTKNDLSQEKAYRYRLNRSVSNVTTSRPASSKSISSVNDFSPHWIDPRNPDAWRPKSSRSIPSKCNRYILVNKPKDKNQKPIPSPLEEQLLIERFPRLGSKVVQAVPDLTPRMKKSYNLEYTPFVYQRFV